MTGRAAFPDRQTAGSHLAERLRGFTFTDPVVYAVPRGGVPVGFEIAKRLRCPLDVVMVRKIDAPDAYSQTIAAVVEGLPPMRVRNDDLIQETGLKAAALTEMCQQALEDLARLHALYLGGRTAADPKGRSVIVADDGLETGLTMVAAIRGLRGRGAQEVIVAAPVGAPGALDRLAWEADAVICPVQPQNFHSIGDAYADFRPVDDGEVMALLGAARDFGWVTATPTA